MSRYHKDDAGIVLVSVVGAIALITILAVSAFAISSQALHQTTITVNHQAAFTGADSGVQVAVAAANAKVVANGGTDASVVVTGTTSGAGWTTTIAPVSGSPGTYSLVSVGTASDGTAERILGDIQVTPAVPAPIGPWGYMLSNGGFNAGATWQGGVSGKLVVSLPAGTTMPTVFLGNNNNSNSDIGWTSADVYLWNANKVTWGKVNQSGQVAVPVHVNQLPLAQDGWKVLGKAAVQDLPPDRPELPQPNSQAAPSGAIIWPVGNLTFGNTNLGTAGSDFFYNGTTGLLHLNGTLYVDGVVTFAKAIKYEGSGTIMTAPGHEILIKANIVPDTTLGEMDATHVLGLNTNTFIDCYVGGTSTATKVVGAFYAGTYIMVNSGNKAGMVLKGTAIVGATGVGTTGQNWGIVAGNNTANKKGDIPDLVLDDLDWGAILPAGMPRLAGSGDQAQPPMAILSNWRRL